MSDIFDRASELEQLQTERALSQQRERAQLGATGDWRKLSAKWCKTASCGERIPDARRAALPGVQVCVDCASHHEKQQGRRK